MFIASLIAIIVALLLSKIIWKRPRKFPPGPSILPILGSIPFLKWNEKYRIRHYNLAKTYGPIVGYYVGMTPIVLLNSAEVINEVFRLESATNRPPSEGSVAKFRHETDDGNVRGLFFSRGLEWQEQRRFTLRTLKDYGFDKVVIEDIMLEEVDKLVKFIRKDEGQIICLADKFNISILNVLWSILVGEQLQLEDPELANIVSQLDYVVKAGFTTTPLLMQICPRLYTVFNKSKCENFDNLFKDILRLLQSRISEHKRNFNPDNLKDFIDTYIKEIKAETNPNSSFYSNFGYNSLESTLLDLFLAGSETTSSSLQWAILYLIKYPNVQFKIHDEMDKVLSKSSDAITLEDKIKLPYLSAVILESMRLASLVPFGVPHYATSDIVVSKYVIPKGSVVIGHVLYAHHDPNYWKDPEDFIPERFLSEDGQTLRNDKHCIPFLIGRRACPGQSLAEKELFLFMAGILRNFKFSSVGDLPSISISNDTTSGLIRSPPIFPVKIQSRKD